MTREPIGKSKNTSFIIHLTSSLNYTVISGTCSLKEEVIEGKTGFMCNPQDPQDLAEKIEQYFKSDLYKNLEENRDKIIEYANEKYSWEKVAEKTYDVYKSLLSTNN